MALSVAIATLWDGSPSYECALLLWCRSAMSLARLVNASLVVVGTTEQSVDCPLASYVWPADVADAAAAYSAYLAKWQGRVPHTGRVRRLRGILCEPNLLKISLLGMTQFDVVLFADLDVDVAPDGHDRNRLPAKLSSIAWRAGVAAFASSRALITASPDKEAPVNMGSFLMKPRRWAYLRLLSELRTLTFTPMCGFNGAGRPRDLNIDLASLSLGLGTVCCAAAASLLNRTRMITNNTWSFAGGATDQGLLWWFFYVELRVGTWAATDGAPLWRVDHW